MAITRVSLNIFASFINMCAFFISGKMKLVTQIPVSMVAVCLLQWLTDELKQSNPPKIVSEYDQEIPQSQTADNPVAPRGRAAQPSRDTRKTN